MGVSAQVENVGSPGNVADARLMSREFTAGHVTGQGAFVTVRRNPIVAKLYVFYDFRD